MPTRVSFALLATLAMTMGAVPRARAANWPDRPQLRAVRVATPPSIDGDLSDPAWQSAPEFTDFTQHDPHDGQPATLRTSIRIVYDEHAIYFGAMLEDPQRPIAQLVRRDTMSQSDFLSINLDPQHDRLSGSAFTITPANVQIDSVLYNDIGEDGSWDGVWESATKIVANGWAAEVRVPYSQLRFAHKDEHVWGINITRRTTRTNEMVRIVNTPKGQTGFVSHFADIVGIEGVRRGRPLEIVPYAVARGDVLTRADRSNPLLDTRDSRIDAGLDLKYALTPRLTLTGTVNPDFGQVEVDPAVVNLSEFETFYPEKRPFFTEGLNIFNFGDSPATSHFGFINQPDIFYSRRIGRAPQTSPDADYSIAPHETTILGAAKVTGSLGRGWSIGVLDALTDAERARFLTSTGSEERLQVEPMTNYFVGRARKNIGTKARLGVFVTSVDRRLTDEMRPLLRDSALTFGIDGYRQSADKAWVLEGEVVSSRVSGSREAILSTQRSSARYYQRPDAEHVELDPTRTSLDGWGGRVMFSKSTGVWRPNVSVQGYSPGYETNDVGFMQRTDIISGSALLLYVNEKPTKYTRERVGWAGVWQNSNFDGDVLERGFVFDAQMTSQKYWEYRASLFFGPGTVDDRLTRGGPVVRTPSWWQAEVGMESDARKKFSWEVNGHLNRSDDGSYERSIGLELNARPMSNLQVSVEPWYSRERERNQYVRTVIDPSATQTFGRRYVVGNLEQESFEVGARVDWTLTPTLSFQVYLQPYISAGDYGDYRQLAAPRTRDFVGYGGNVGDPDFNFHSVRGSAVARWEFRPGSALYVVWNENRADVLPLNDFSPRRDFRNIANAPSQDVFLVKVSYWLPM
ncbi:MAG: DUF5916 domain-containing protein [Thermoanaerobaculia bacterium]